MFKEMGQMLSLMKNLPKLKASMEEFQQKVGQISADGSAGGGMVAVKANGRQEIVACTISPEAFALNDREMLEDLVIAAVNQALGKVRAQVAEESAKIASDAGLPLPPGGLGGLPGLS